MCIGAVFEARNWDSFGWRATATALFARVSFIASTASVVIAFSSLPRALRSGLASHSSDLQLSKSGIAYQCAGKGIGRKTNQHVAECGGDYDCAGSRAR